MKVYYNFLNKKNVLIILFLLYSGGVEAQFSYGLKGGLSYVTVNKVDTENAFRDGYTEDHILWKPSYHLGFFSNYAITERVSILSEFVYANKGYAYDFKERTNVNLHYVTIPLLYQYKLFNKFRMEAGIELGLLLSAKVDDFDLKKEFKVPDLGAALGVHYSITDKMDVSLRYTHGVSNTLQEDFGSSELNSQPSLYDRGLRYRNQSFQLSLAYSLHQNNKVENGEGKALYTPKNEQAVIATIGFRLGASSYTMFGSEVELRERRGATSEPRNSLELGMDARITFYKYAYLSIGASYINKGGHLQGGGWVVNEPVEVSYLNVPLVAGVSLIKTIPISLSLEGGLAHNLELSADIPYSRDIVSGYYTETNNAILSKLYGVELSTDALTKVTVFLNYRASEDLNFFHARKNDTTGENYELWNKGYSICLGIRLKPLKI